MVEVPVIDIDESSEAFTGHNDHITTEFNESEHRDTFEASNTNYISRSQSDVLHDKPDDSV